jgi:hypothetical protein
MRPTLPPHSMFAFIERVLLLNMISLFGQQSDCLLEDDDVLLTAALDIVMLMASRISCCTIEVHLPVCTIVVNLTVRMRRVVKLLTVCTR